MDCFTENQKSIFISIPSYRDPELVHTIINLIDNAKFPHLLHISVCWQDIDINDISIFENTGFSFFGHKITDGIFLYCFSYKNSFIDIIPFYFYDSKGVGWARAVSQSTYKGEMYFLQIDSHSRFIPEWDVELISMLSDLSFISVKPLISTYPPNYKPGVEEERDLHTYKLIFDGFTDDSKIISQNSTLIISDKPERNTLIAAGFIFTYGNFINEVPSDPDIFFYGEELSTAIRAFTHGYDVYCPYKIIMWHYYGRFECTKVWDDQNSKNNISEMAWWDRDKITYSKLVKLFNEHGQSSKKLSPFGLGDKRSFHQFEIASGIFFEKKKVHPNILPPIYQTYFDITEDYTTEMNSNLIDYINNIT